MSKNTNIAELINYVSIDGSGNVVATTGIKKSGGTSSQFLKADGSVDASTYATQTYVTTAVSNLVASAPSTLDTLNELATALGNDANFATTVSTSIGNRVPYTGANADVVLGTNNLKSKNTFVEGDGLYNGGGLRIKQYVSQADGIDNYNTISSQSSGFAFSSSFGGGIFKNFILDASSLTNTTQRVYTLPDASGTLALTSNLSSYLPLAGGTLTGPLAGTTSAFTGFAINATPTSAGTGATFVRYINTGSDWYIGSESSVAGSFFGGASAYASVFFGTNPFQFITSGVKRFEIATGGITSTVGFTGTSATFSGAISATYGTFTSQVTVASPFTIKDTNPYIQWQNSSATRLGYIQHATNLVMSADSGNVVLTTTSGTFTLTSAGPATFSSSVQSTDFRYTNTGYLTYDTANTGTESLIIRKFGTAVLTLDSINRASFASTVFIGGSLFFDTNGSVRTISNYGYGGAIQLLRSDSTSTRWARIGMVDATATNFIGGMTINNDTSATFSSGITTAGTVRINGTSSSRISLESNYSGGNVGIALFNTSGTENIWLNAANGSLNCTGPITTSGSITISSRTVFTAAAIYDNASAGNNVGIGFGPNCILPISGTGATSSGTKDLGSSSVRWATVYTSDLSLSNGIGDYTIVEGENDLFLYNNKQNKVYKFMLAEVDPADATPKKS